MKSLRGLYNIDQLCIPRISPAVAVRCDGSETMKNSNAGSASKKNQFRARIWFVGMLLNGLLNLHYRVVACRLMYSTLHLMT